MLEILTSANEGKFSAKFRNEKSEIELAGFVFLLFFSISNVCVRTYRTYVSFFFVLSPIRVTLLCK